MMNHRIGMSLVFGVALIVVAGFARAQEPPPPGADVMIHPGVPGGDFMAPPMGERIELLGFEGMHGGKVVTGAPFSAVAETTQTLADGNRISRRTEIVRDSQGRFRKNVTISGAPKSFVVIRDPVSSTSYILHAESKTAEKMGGHGMKGPRKGAMKDAIKGKMGARQQELMAEGNLKKEDLGTQPIGGVSAQGTRYTRTIPVGQIGNEKPITIVSEHWYSNDLQMVVMSKRSDPRFGDTTYTLTKIQRSEPAASLFTVPSDYTVTQGRPGHHGNVIFKQAPAPSPEN